ncbi:hypothetical protein SKTS_00070 [Sulfurimicrobium lacus]|uniref:LysM domain-containing protein n=1 Tax=Sulfurimicrobium lacus TaxID=2715678 RepID=A0A6F8V7M3_9PROT|nr:LysM peptidoglycan-binding domain-containing protein [Sulfurimicrobium lacus]BCB25121.1 hypothetical protein SKTS_00070 [Sulfurimicrobium lacus]
MRKPIIIAVLSLSGFISSLVGADEIKLQDNPPQQYTVVKGDTLWGISSRFLKDPWRWPELWRMNREQIKNPHWIYPGDKIVLDMTGGSPHLRLLKGERTEKLSPRVRAESLESQAIPPIPSSAIGPFLTQALILDGDTLDDAPYIVGTEDERNIIGPGDKIYANGAAKDSETRNWGIFRKGKALIDPDTEETLGYESEYIGESRTVQSDDVMTLEITRAVQEARRDDRLMPSTPNRVLQAVPHAPTKSINGSIISAYGPSNEAAKYQTVVINKGSKDGLEEGNVLAVYRKGRTVQPTSDNTSKKAWRYVDRECVKEDQSIKFDQFYDPKDTLEPCKSPADAAARSVIYTDIGCLKPGAKVSFGQTFNPKDVYTLHCRTERPDAVTLPDSRTGLIFVYRVFNRVSYALVMSSSRPVYLLDVVKNP